MSLPALKRICVLRTSALGDVVHCLAFVHGLRLGFPDAHITWVTQDIPAQLVDGHPDVNRLIRFRRKMSCHEWLNFRRLLKSEKFDLLIVLQSSVKASLITTWIPARLKLGFDFARSREFTWFVTNRHIPSKKPGHVLDQFMEFLSYLEIDYPEPVWDFHVSSEEQEWKRKWLNNFTRPLVALIPASSRPEKDWSPHKYADLADRISDILDLEPVIVCGPGKRENAIALAIHEEAGCKPHIASEKPVRNSLLQLSCAQVVVGPDTGPLHMAVALNIPTVGLYGYSNPRRCGPYRFRNLLVDKYNDSGDLTEAITRKTKPDRMNRITVDDVFEKIQMALDLYPQSAAE